MHPFLPLLIRPKIPYPLNLNYLSTLYLSDDAYILTDSKNTWTVPFKVVKQSVQFACV